MNVFIRLKAIFGLPLLSVGNYESVPYSIGDSSGLHMGTQIEDLP